MHSRSDVVGLTVSTVRDGLRGEVPAPERPTVPTVTDGLKAEGPVTSADWIRGLLAATGSGHTPVTLEDPTPTLWQCPAHDDARPSLSILDPDEDHPAAAVHCFAGCDVEKILAALKLTRAALTRTPRIAPAAFADLAGVGITYPALVLGRRGTGGAGTVWRFETSHPYGDRWRLVRWRATNGEKDLRWETRDDAGAWIPGLRDTALRDLPLYLEREIVAAVALGETVFVVESESSVDALTGRGLYATTWAGGATAPNLARLRRALTSAHVVLVPDNDDPGRRCAAQIETALTGHAATLRTILPARGCDARDLLAADPAAFTQHDPSR